MAALRFAPGMGVNLGHLPPPLRPQVPASLVQAATTLQLPPRHTHSLASTVFPPASLPIIGPSAPATNNSAAAITDRARLQLQMAALQRQMDALGSSTSSGSQGLAPPSLEYQVQLQSASGDGTAFVPCPVAAISTEDPAGFLQSDPGHPDHVAAARGEDYSGQRPGKLYQERRRLAGISPVQWAGNSPMYWPGSLLSSHADREHRASLPDQQAYSQYLSQRLATWLARLRASQGVFSPHHPDGAWHKQKAKFIIVRYQLLATLILHLQGTLGQSWETTWLVLVMIIQDFEGNDFQHGLPSDRHLLSAFDQHQAATPYGNQLIASLAPSLLPSHYLSLAQNSAADNQAMSANAAVKGPSSAKASTQATSARSNTSQQRCGACGQTGHTYRTCTNPVVNKCRKCGHLHHVSGKNATPCIDPPAQGREAAAGSNAGSR